MRETILAADATSAGMEPRILKAGGGWRWLAVAPDGANPSIAVLADTENEARTRYKDSARSWAVLLHDATVY